MERVTGGSLGARGPTYSAPPPAPSNSSDVGFLERPPGIVDALCIKTDRFLDILSRQGIEYELQHAIFELLATVFVTIGNIRALQQAVDIADGIGRHLELLHQALKEAAVFS